MPVKEIDLEDFARRVERLCEHILSTSSVGTWARFHQVYTLKEDAADLQFPSIMSIKDLHKYIKEGSK